MTAISKRSAKKLVNNAVDLLLDGLDNHEPEISLHQLAGQIASAILQSASHIENNGVFELAQLETELGNGLNAGVTAYSQLFGVDAKTKPQHGKGVQEIH